MCLTPPLYNVQHTHGAMREPDCTRGKQGNFGNRELGVEDGGCGGAGRYRTKLMHSR